MFIKNVHQNLNKNTHKIFIRKTWISDKKYFKSCRGHSRYSKSCSLQIWFSTGWLCFPLNYFFLLFRIKLTIKGFTDISIVLTINCLQKIKKWNKYLLWLKNLMHEFLICKLSPLIKKKVFFFLFVNIHNLSIFSYTWMWQSNFRELNLLSVFQFTNIR